MFFGIVWVFWVNIDRGQERRMNPHPWSHKPRAMEAASTRSESIPSALRTQLLISLSESPCRSTPLFPPPVPTVVIRLSLVEINQPNGRGSQTSDADVDVDVEEMRVFRCDVIMQDTGSMQLCAVLGDR